MVLTVINHFQWETTLAYLPCYPFIHILQFWIITFPMWESFNCRNWNTLLLWNFFIKILCQYKIERSEVAKNGNSVLHFLFFLKKWKFALYIYNSGTELPLFEKSISSFSDFWLVSFILLILIWNFFWYKSILFKNEKYEIKLRINDSNYLLF